MNTDQHRWKTNKITEAVTGAAFKAGNTSGCGFLEKVHENALAIEIRKGGLLAIQQIEIKRVMS